MLSPKPEGEEGLLWWSTCHLGLHLAFLIVALVVRFLVFKILATMTKTTNTSFDDLLFAVLSTLFSNPVCAAVLGYFLESTDPVNPTFAKIWLSATILLVSIQVATALNLIVQEVSKHIGASKGVTGAATTISRGISFLVYALGLLMAFDNLGFQVSFIVAGFGLGGMAVSFAAQQTLRDVIAALALFLDQPAVESDIVDIGGVVGSLEQIGLRSTKVRALTGELVLIPNSTVAGASVKNWTHCKSQLASVEFCISPGTSDEKLRALPGLLKQIRVDKVDITDSNFKSFEAGAIRWDVWVNIHSGNPVETRQAKGRLNTLINELLKKEGYNPPFPVRVLLKANGVESVDI